MFYRRIKRVEALPSVCNPELLYLVFESGFDPSFASRSLEWWRQNLEETTTTKMMKMPTLNSSGRVFPVAADIPKREVTIYEVVRTVLSVTVISRFAATRNVLVSTAANVSRNWSQVPRSALFSQRDRLLLEGWVVYECCLNYRVCCFSCYQR